MVIMHRIDELTKVARDVALAYKQSNTFKGRQPWSIDQYMAGFVGDVGDLSKLVMAKAGYREADGVDERIAHELADCLWSILIIADELGVDLAAVYRQNMGTLLRQIMAERDH
jgi:NTP pyrophosphatase (non-canonical NTP hydrolase)